MLILVDLDGTLIPLKEWEPVFRDVSGYIASRAGVSVEYVYARARALNRELMLRFDARAFDWDYIFSRIAYELGVDYGVSVIDALKIRVRDFRPFEGALDLLRAIREHGHRVGIATNGYFSYQSIVLEELGFMDYIDELRTPDKVGCVKNCREFFEGARVMIGDNPLFDVYYPSIYGLFTIFVGDWELGVRRVRDMWGIELGVKPHLIVNNLNSLNESLRGLLKKL